MSENSLQRKDLDWLFRSAQGRLGELLYANYLNDISEGQIVCTSLGKKDGQDRGIDWLVDYGGLSKELVDVKLNIPENEQDSSFSFYTRSKNGPRHPNRKSKIGKLSIVTFNWTLFTRGQTKSITKSSFEHLNSIIEELENEYESKGPYIRTKQLIHDYVWSIVDVNLSPILNFLSATEVFDKCYLEDDKEEVFLAARRLNYYPEEKISIYWKALNEKYDYQWHFQNKNPLAYSLPIDSLTFEEVCSIPWIYPPNDRVTIDAQGRRLFEMTQEELEWIRNQNKSSRSTFRGKFHCSQSYFHQILTDLLEGKMPDLSKIEA